MIRIQWYMKVYTNKGETVLDNCMGSGTTAVACINTNRNFIGFEITKEYLLDFIKKNEELSDMLYKYRGY